jgi:hypothetical protein
VGFIATRRHFALHPPQKQFVAPGGDSLRIGGFAGQEYGNSMRGRTADAERGRYL